MGIHFIKFSKIYNKWFLFDNLYHGEVEEIGDFK